VSLIAITRLFAPLAGPDDEDALVQIDVGPLQMGDLDPTEARVQDQHEYQPVTLPNEGTPALVTEREEMPLFVIVQEVW
jgi:hypothetical protein